jgi:hypothetical protein
MGCAGCPGLGIRDTVFVHSAISRTGDTSIVRVHQHGSGISGNAGQQMGRSRGGLTSKIHAVVAAIACLCISASRPVRRTTTVYVRLSSVD